MRKSVSSKKISRSVATLCFRNDINPISYSTVLPNLKLVFRSIGPKYSTNSPFEDIAEMPITRGGQVCPCVAGGIRPLPGGSATTVRWTDESSPWRHDRHLLAVRSKAVRQMSLRWSVADIRPPPPSSSSSARWRRIVSYTSYYDITQGARWKRYGALARFPLRQSATTPPPRHRHGRATGSHCCSTGSHVLYVSARARVCVRIADNEFTALLSTDRRGVCVSYDHSSPGGSL